MRNQGRDPSLDWHQQAEVGFSYRLSEMNCALGLEQLKRIEKIIKRRQALAEIYDKKLADIPQIIRPSITCVNGLISRFVYCVQLASDYKAKDRDAICASLASRGIATARYFAPLHLQPVAKNLSAPPLPNTESAADRILALPFFHELTEAQMNEVCMALRESIHALRRNT